jgi:hypothetical protein
MASVAERLLPSFRPKAFAMFSETFMPSLKGPLPVVLDAGAEDLGDEDTPFAAAEDLTSAAVEPIDTLFLPAGVSTETVPDFAGDAAEALAPEFPAAVPEALMPLLPPEEPPTFPEP